MVSRLLSALDKRIEMTASHSERLGLFADRAGVLARLGQLDAARAELNRLRDANKAYEPELTARILLNEGLLDHFSYQTTGAKDKFRRAYAISAAAGAIPLRSRCAAWLSTNEFQVGNIAAAAERVSEALSGVDADDQGSLSRAHLVVADLLSYAGQGESAAEHYRLARHHASLDGDLSMQSAVLFNYAAFRVQSLSLSDIDDSRARPDATTVDLEVSSIGNLDEGLGIRSLQSMVPLLRAQLRTAQGRWAEAVELFDSNLDCGESEVLDREMSKLLACRALCHVRLDRVEKAWGDAERARNLLPSSVDLDDLAIAHGRLAVALATINADMAEEHRSASARCMALFLEQQASHSELIGRALRAHIAGGQK